MAVKTDISFIVNKIKEGIDQNALDATLLLVNELVTDLWSSKSRACLRSMIQSLKEEDLIYVIRALDAGLMHHYSEFLIRYRYRHHRSPQAIIYNCYAQSGNFKILEAEDEIKHLLANEAGTLDKSILKQAYSALANLLIDMKRFGEAKEYLLKYEELGDEPLYDRWGLYYFHSGEWEKARGYLLKGIKLDSKPQFCYITLQSVYAAQGNFEEAFNILDQGIAAVPSFLPLRLEKANKLKQLERWEEYSAVIQEIDNLSPYHALKKYFVYSRGSYLYHHGEYEAFLSYIEKNQAIFKGTVYSKCISNSPDNIKTIPSRIVVQKYNYCVPATLSMLLSRYNLDKDQDEIANHIFGINGSTIYKSVEYLESIGMACKYFFGDIARLKKLTRDGISVILCLDYESSSHVQLLQGYDDNLQALCVQDPNLLEMQMVGYEEYENYYANNQYLSIAVVPNNQKDELAQLDEHHHALVSRMQGYMEAMENNSHSESEFAHFVTASLEHVYVMAYAIKLLNGHDNRELLGTAVQKVTSLYPESDYFKLISGNALIKAHLYEEAAVMLDNIQEKSSHYYFYNRGRIALDNNRFREAMAQFRDALNHEPDHYHTWSFLALSHYYLDEGDAAYCFSSISLDINSEDYWNRVNHGIILGERHEYAEAREMLTGVIKDFKELPVAWYERARCDLELGRMSHALRGFAVAKHLDPEIEHPYREIANIYAEHYEDFERAAEELEEGLGKAGEKYTLLVALGDLLGQLENYEAAKNRFMEAKVLYPEEAYPALALAKLMHETEKPEQALEWLVKEAENYYEDSYFLINGGNWLFNHDQEEGAQELALNWFEKGLDLAEQNLDDAWNMYVELVGETAFNERGRRFLESQRKAKYQENSDLIFYIGYLYEQNCQFEQAVECFKTSFEVNQAAFPLYRLGEVAFKLGNITGAKQYYFDTLQLDKDFVPAYLRLAEIANREEDRHEEQARLLSVLKISPFDVDMPYFADLSHEIGKIRKVISQLTLLKDQVDETWRLYAMAQCASVQGKLNFEATCLEKGLELAPDHFMLLTSYSGLLLKQEKYEEATGLILDLLVKNPEERGLYVNLADAMFAAGKLEKLKNLLSGLEITDADKSKAYMYAACELEQLVQAMQSSEGSWLRQLSKKRKIKAVENQLVDLYRASYHLDSSNILSLIWLYEYFGLNNESEKSRKESGQFLEDAWNIEIALYYSQLVVNEYTDCEHPEKEKEFSKVEAYLHKCLEEQPENPIAHYTLGKMYNDVLRLEEAEQHLETALELDSLDPDYYYEFSRLCEKNGQFKKGELLARRALQISPDYLVAYNQISILSHLQGRTEEALKLIEELLAMDDGLLVAHYNKACYLSVLGGDVEEAFAHLEFAVVNLEDDYFRNLGKDDPDLELLRSHKATAKKMKKLLS
jgi:tetratricopeptide (TPR) repeat protein